MLLLVLKRRGNHINNSVALIDRRMMGSESVLDFRNSEFKDRMQPIHVELLYNFNHFGKEARAIRGLNMGGLIEFRDHKYFI